MFFGTSVGQDQTAQNVPIRRNGGKDGERDLVRELVPGPFLFMGVFLSLLRVLRTCSRSMEYFETVCHDLQNTFWLFLINRGVAHLLTESPRDSKWRKEESYFSVKEQCSENTPFRTEEYLELYYNIPFKHSRTVFQNTVHCSRTGEWNTPYVNLCLNTFSLCCCRMLGDAKGNCR